MPEKRKVMTEAEADRALIDFAHALLSHCEVVRSTSNPRGFLVDLPSELGGPDLSPESRRVGIAAMEEDRELADADHLGQGHASGHRAVCSTCWSGACAHVVRALREYRARIRPACYGQGKRRQWDRVQRTRNV